MNSASNTPQPDMLSTRIHQGDNMEGSLKLTEEEKRKIDLFQQSDKAYRALTLGERHRNTNWLARGLFDVDDQKANTTQDYDWLGPTNLASIQSRVYSKPQLLFPQDLAKLKQDAHAKRGAVRPSLNMSKSELKKIANAQEKLIPIRIDCEQMITAGDSSIIGSRIRECFVWNAEDTHIPLPLFASHLMADLNLPAFHQDLHKEIVLQMQKAIEESTHNFEVTSEGENATSVKKVDLPNNSWSMKDGVRPSSRKLTDDDWNWWLNWGKAIRGEEDAIFEPESMDNEQEDSSIPPPGGFQQGDIEGNEELRIPIRIDIISSAIHLVDRFEWDMSNDENDPEEFAKCMGKELGLHGEFITAIAHSIREQIDTYHRSLILLSHVPGQQIADEDLRKEFLPALIPTKKLAQDGSALYPTVFRSDPEYLATHSPTISLLTAEEIDRSEREKDRDIRRKRRQTKGRGPMFPDREFFRTHRTTVPQSSSQPNITPYQTQQGEYAMPPFEFFKPYPIVLKDVGPMPVFPVDPLFEKVGKRIEEDSGVIGRKAKLEQLGLHEHIVDGQWFCANCGVPEALTDGQRKGPSGSKSLCGSCGKFFHRYRKNRPYIYSTDPAVHIKARADAAAASQSVKDARKTQRIEDRQKREKSCKTEVKRRGRKRIGGDEEVTTVLDQDSSDDFSVGDYSSSSSRDNDDEEDIPLRRLKARRIAEIQDSDSSDTSRRSENIKRRRKETTPQIAPLVVAPSPMVGPPAWFEKEAEILRTVYPHEKFEIIQRPLKSESGEIISMEWRLRCLDCPGRVYNLGPGETLDNFIVHFKNRHHRANVDARLGATNNASIGA